MFLFSVSSRPGVLWSAQKWLHLSLRKSKSIPDLERKSHKTHCTGKTTRWVSSTLFCCNISVGKKCHLLQVMSELALNFFPGLNNASLFLFSQAPVQIKEFGAITNIDFSPVAPHNFAVTAFTRVCWLRLYEIRSFLFTQFNQYSHLHNSGLQSVLDD